MNEKVGVPLIKRQEKTKILRHSDQLIEENGATEFSNPVSKDFEIDSKKIAKRTEIDEFDSKNMKKSTHATEFSNVSYHDTTKNSNSDDIYNIVSKTSNPSINIHNSHENLNKLSQNDLISIWAESDLYC